MKKHLKQLWVNTLPDNLFSPDISIDRAKDLFTQYVALVEMENHSFCNRTCWFCPNSFIDRHSSVELLREEDYERILADLKEISYNRILAWSCFHEPLAHDSIFARIKKARDGLPHALLAMVSNGDYLNKEVLLRLVDSGLNRLKLNLYLPAGKEEDEKEFERSLEKFAERTGLTPEKKISRKYKFPGFEAIRISLSVPNYKIESISTRAGLLQIPKTKTYKRTAACLSPIYHVIIDFKGKGMLCCQTRSDAPEHKTAIIGDLGNEGYGLFHLYRDMAKARLALVEPGCKAGLCQSCDVSTESNDGIYQSMKFHDFLTKIPGSEFLSTFAVKHFILKAIQQ